MKLANFFPCPALQPYIKGYMIIESDEGTVNTTLPDTSIVMAFRFRGKVDLSRIVFRELSRYLSSADYENHPESLLTTRKHRTYW